MTRIRLSRRLVLLMFAAMFPVVGVLFYNLFALHTAREAEIHKEAYQAGQLAALEMQRVLSGMEGILQTVSSAPVVQRFDTEGCGDFLARTVARVPGIRTIGIIGADGLLKCRNDRQGIGTSLADRQYFKAALQTGGFVVGEYTKSRITGEAVLPLAVPIKDQVGKTTGVVAMSLDLSWLQKTLADRKFDTGSALTLADRNGVILVRHPLPGRFVGTKIPDQYQYLVHATAPGTIELTSQDGTRRVLAYFPEGVTPKGLYISAGLSVEDSFASIRRATIFGIAATVFAIVCSLLLAWQTHRSAIQKPVNRILGALNAWSNDKSEVRTGMTPDGDELETIGVAIDGFMDELVASRQQRDLLEAEMAHRIKNVLAIVQSVAHQTFKRDIPAAEALSTFSKRLAAISDAFMVLGREHQAADLTALVKVTVAPFENPDHPQFSIDGPQFKIGAKPALALAMALHELCTNAVKYGALGESDGRVEITWGMKDTDLTFKWQEHDGPAVVPPGKKGFGSRMMEAALSAQTGADISIEYLSTGLLYAFKAPLENLAAEPQEQAFHKMATETIEKEPAVTS